MYSSEVQIRGGENRRAAARGAAGFDTRLRLPSSATRSPCRIIDISCSGARLRLYQQLAPETSIRLSLPGKGLVDAHIVWADGREAGCRFDRPLDDATVIVLQASATERGA
ncbi:MAG: PilZ domain-containing protein [Pseudomonadota bacterium]